MADSLPATASFPKFPADIFYHVLMYVGTQVDDLVWLWRSCRAVSHDFEDAVERVFITRHLSKTFLSVNGGVAHDKKQDDRTRAIYRDKQITDHAKPFVVEHLKSVFKHDIPVGKPKITIQIRHHANDTLVPDLVPNWDDLEMTVNWRGMYSEWYREEEEHSRRLEAYVEASKLEMVGMREKFERGEINEGQLLRWTFKTMGNAHQALWKEVRTERIARNVCSQPGTRANTGAVDSDMKGCEHLQAMRSNIQFQKFSDDEEDGEEEDGERDDDDDAADREGEDISDEESEETTDEEVDESVEEVGESDVEES